MIAGAMIITGSALCVVLAVVVGVRVLIMIDREERQREAKS